MHDRTISTLGKLEGADWFRNTGRKDTEAAIVLSSWKEAMKSCASPEWQDLILEASNRYSEKIAKNSPERFKQWNIVVRELKTATIPLVERKTERVIRENRLLRIFKDTVNWDILHVAIEAEYADIYTPGFFASQAYWYIKGHFPCGWQGEFPDGKLIIF